MLKTMMRGLWVAALCAFCTGMVAQSHATPVTGVLASIAAPAALPLSAVAYGAAPQPSSSSVAGDAVGATDARVAAPAAGEDGCFVINPTGNSGVDRGLLQGSGTLNLRACGAKLDGATNDYPALVAAYAALAKAGGGTLYVPNGTIAIPSATSAALIVPANTTTQCQPGARFLVTGSAELGNLFLATNASNVWFRGCSFYGNSVATPYSHYAGAIAFVASATAAADVVDFGTSDCTFANFKQEIWVGVLNFSSYAMRHIVHSRPTAISLPGNMMAPSAIGEVSVVFSFSGQQTDVAGVIDDITIEQPDADGTWIKTFAAFWSGTSRFTVNGGSLRNFGAHAGPSAAGYTILIYNLHTIAAATPPAKGVIRGTAIINPFSCGVYAASSIDITLSRLTISGQSDTAEATLPKAAIVFNGVTGATVTGNTLSGNHGGVYASGQGMILIADNHITSAQTSAFGIRIQSLVVPPFSSSSTLHQLLHNSIDVTGAGSFGIDIQSSAGIDPGEVQIIGGQVRATYADIWAHQAVGPFAGAGVEASGGLILGGSPSNGAFIFENNSPLKISDLIIDGAALPPGASGLVVVSSTQVSLNNIVLRNRATATTGYMFVGAGAQGALAGLQFINVANNPFYPAGLGIEAPTWVASAGTFVQNLNVTETGAVSSKYVVRGWTNTNGTTVWNESRVLTGN